MRSAACSMNARYSHTKSKYCRPMSMSNCAARMRRMASCDSFQPSIAMTLASSGAVRSRPPLWKRLRMRMAKTSAVLSGALVPAFSKRLGQAGDARALLGRSERKQIVEGLAVAPRHQTGDVFQHAAEVRRLAVFFVLVAQVLHHLPVLVVQLDALGLRDHAHGFLAVIGREQIAFHIGLQFGAIDHISHVAILRFLSIGRSSRHLGLADEKLVVPRRHF